MKKAFLVILDYDPATAPEPFIGDVHWAVIQQPWWPQTGWDAHTTVASPRMLAHHGVPYPESEEP